MLKVLMSNQKSALMSTKLMKGGVNVNNIKKWSINVNIESVPMLTQIS